MRLEIFAYWELGPFEHRWWAPGAGTERFDRAWECDVLVDGHTSTVRHALGRREAYGRPRRRSVTWLVGHPIVEGVEADDYGTSRSLLTAIKRPDRKLARRREEVPPGYERFAIVDHRAEIRARYSRRALAVKIPEDDVPAWVALAVLRARDLGRLPGGRQRGGSPARSPAR